MLGLGKLGGLELNYSSDIDLIFLCESEGQTDGPRPISNIEFFDLVARELIRLLTERTELGSVYRVDMRLRPEGLRGPMVMGVDSAMRYYDNRGRTWERQAYIKARPVAGDLSLGDEFLESLWPPWIYRRYLSHADISGIKAPEAADRAGVARPPAAARDVKTGRGGIRDIEFVIQFLQLLNGGDLPELRTGNTLEALAQLDRAGCLTNQERSILEENYAFLRKIEHRLQIMLDLQTHLLPEKHDDLAKLALRMGYATDEKRSALEAFLADYRGKTELNRKILDHLLHDAFSDDRQTQAEVDLVLDPDPPPERIVEVLGKYRFRDVKQAYRNLMSLAEERIRFLSTRRCQHFLAAIAPQLLSAIAETADPDSTLVNLDQVSDSLGGKGALWELFSFNPPSLRLYVELCAYSPYLSGILTSNPGMIDGLMDSLVLDKLPTREKHGAAIGRALPRGRRHRPDPAELQERPAALRGRARCLGQGRHPGHDRRAVGYRRNLPGADRRAGIPAAGRSLWPADGRRGPTSGQALRNGHSGPGQVRRPRDELPQRPRHHFPLRGRRTHRGRLETKREGDGGDFAESRKAQFREIAPSPSFRPRQTTTNQHFFSELGQRIIKAASRLTSYGRLYEVDVRLRPTGKSGALATTFDEFARYFPAAAGSSGSGRRCARLGWSTVRRGRRRRPWPRWPRSAFAHRWQRDDAVEIRQMRERLEESAAAAGDLKRGPGGIVDVEFLVQMLQLKHARGNAAASRPQHARGARRSCTGPACSRSTTTSCSTRATGCCGRSKAGCG